MLKIPLLVRFLALCVAMLSVGALAAQKIDEIRVQGNRAVHSDAVTGLLTSKVGENLDPATVRSDVQAIYKSGYFQDVRMEKLEEGGKTILIVSLVEKPSIREIRFSGFKEVTESTLKDKLQTKKYTIVDERKINQDLRLIEQTYVEKGYYLARATYSLEKQDSGEVDLVFSVVENNPVSVSTVHVLGNVYLSDSELKAGMFTRERRWGSWLTAPSGTFKDEFVNRDRSFLEYAFRDTGFAEATSSAPQSRLDTGRQNVEVSFFVEEGLRYNVGKIKITGDLLFSEANIKERLSLKEGSLYRVSQFQNDIRTLTDMYGDEGYAFADPLPRVFFRREQKLIDIEFVITKGEKVYFRNIVIEGNSKTRDNVIRRNMKVAEGDRFHSTNLEKSKAAIERLGFFQEVQILREPDAKNKAMDIRVKVKEKMTGSLNASLFASPSTGERREIEFGAQLNYAENNLLGKGWGANLSGKLQGPGNPDNKGYELDASLSEPSINDGPWSARVFGNYRYNLSLPYAGEPHLESVRKTLGLSVGREIIEDLRFTLGYSYTRVDIAGQTPLLNRFNEHGDTERVSQSLSYDRTDNYLMPTSGYSLSVTNTLGVKGIGGEHRFGKVEGSAALYVPVVFFDDVRTNFRFAVEPGYVYSLRGEQIPLWERFELGGPSSMKAYQYAKVISPRVNVMTSTTEGLVGQYKYGGNRRIYGSAEYFFPLIPEANLRLVTFLESGTVLDDKEKFDVNSLKHDVGFGFRWHTPLAPFRFEWAWPLEKGKLGESEFVFFIGFDSQSSF